MTDDHSMKEAKEMIRRIEDKILNKPHFVDDKMNKIWKLETKIFPKSTKVEKVPCPDMKSIKMVMEKRNKKGREVEITPDVIKDSHIYKKCKNFNFFSSTLGLI